MSPGDAGFDDLVDAYEGVEDLAGFPDPSELARYRVRLLERSAEQLEFLAARMAPGASVLEVGCGNGRLLVALARRGLLASGLGLDLARSRIRFGRRWAEDEGHAGLALAADDALTHPLPPAAFDLALCVTGTLAYFEPARAGAARALVARLHDALAPGALLCLELYPHAGLMRLLEASEGELRVWRELDDDDPWRFYLSRLTVDADAPIVTHEKTFIHRSSGEIDSGRRERLYMYSAAAIGDLLEDAGFEAVELLGGWQAQPYAPDDDIMLVTARRPAGARGRR